MGSLLRLVLSLVFIAATASALGGAWVDRHLANESGFASATGKLMENPAVQDRIVSLVSVQLSEQEDVPDFLRESVSRATRKGLRSSFETPGFDSAWRTSMIRTHRLHFGPQPPAELTIEAAPFVQLAIDNSRVLSKLKLSAPESLQVQFAKTDVRNGVRVVERIADLWPVSAVIALIAAALLIVSAGRRNMAASVALIGALTITATVVVALGFRVALNEIVPTVAAGERELMALIDAAAAALTPTLDEMLIPVGITGLVILGAGVVWSVLAARQP